ncbi:MAG: hypothetical protein ACE5IH_05615 [Thermodesulfobacteriota bacterium]
MKLNMLSIHLRKLDPFWILTAVFMVISAFLVSNITNRVIVWKLRAPVYSPTKGVKGLAPASKREPGKSLLDIVSQASESHDAPVKRDIPFLTTYKLIGTAVGKRSSSYAFFENISKRNQIILREGESIDGGVMLKKVSSGRVVLIAGGRETTMEIVYEDDRTKDSKRASLSVKRPSSAQPSELTRNLNRREVEVALEDLNKVMTQARIIPYMVKGETKGYRVFSIRPGSIYTKVGLKNGDVMQVINGVKLDSPEKAYQLFQQLKDESRLTLDILRRNQKITITIDIG